MCVRLKRMREATASRARHASVVVAALGVVQLAVQMRQPLAVVRPRPAVEDGISGDAWGYSEPLHHELRDGSEQDHDVAERWSSSGRHALCVEAARRPD